MPTWKRRAACASASASTKVTSSLTTRASMATASTSLPVSKALQSPAEFVSPARCMKRSPQRYRERRCGAENPTGACHPEMISCATLLGFAWDRCMKRREFIILFGGVLVAPHVAARGQEVERVRRIGVLMSIAADDPVGHARLEAFKRGLQQFGWLDARKVEIVTRWGAGDLDGIRNHAGELAALAPDVILGTGSATVGPLLQATRTVPIVFVYVPDPVGAGFVKSLARPGGNATGFTPFEYATAAKWLEVLKEIAPTVTRAAVVRDPTIATGLGQFGAMQSVAASLGIELTPIGVRDLGETEEAIGAFARTPNGGMIVTGSALASVNRDLLVTLAARHKLPAVYFERHFVSAGGLISYGTDIVDQYRRAAEYVDRILKGEKPADLPVQAPTEYQLVINLKTAKSLGITVPPTVLARAAEVIE